MGLPWETLLSECDRHLRRSDIRDLLAVTAQPDVISFAGGLPAPELFPVEELRASFDAVFRTDGPGALQYGPTEGYLPLREFLSARLATQGIRATPDEILLTSGSQQGLDLLGKILLPDQATIMVEAPTYVGALQAFALHRPLYISVPLDEQGICVDNAEQLLDGLSVVQKPRLLYTVATFQNPSGVTMSLARRRQLLSLCTQHQIPVIEDNPYGELRYEAETVPALRALPGGEETIYLGTFSKILAPGLRLGWIIAPRAVITRLVTAKQGTDLHTDSLVQRAVLHFCTNNNLDDHVARIRTVYRERRDAMLAAMSRSFPAGVSWTHPEGGLFTWVTLPEGTDSRVILRAALQKRVAFVVGSAFHPYGEGNNCLRLNFSHSEPARIEEGIQRLAGVLHDTISQPVGAVAVHA